MFILHKPVPLSIYDVQQTGSHYSVELKFFIILKSNKFPVYSIIQFLDIIIEMYILQVSSCDSDKSQHLFRLCLGLTA